MFLNLYLRLIFEMLKSMSDTNQTPIFLCIFLDHQHRRFKIKRHLRTINGGFKTHMWGPETARKIILISILQLIVSLKNWLVPHSASVISSAIKKCTILNV